MKEFQVGDKVYDIVFGNGVVKEADTYVTVYFSELGNYRYTQEGVGAFEPCTKKALYHGHDLKVTVEEKEPNRKKKYWVNLYWNALSEAVVGSEGYPTEEEAIANIEHYYKEDYIKTVKVEV